MTQRFQARHGLVLCLVASLTFVGCETKEQAKAPGGSDAGKVESKTPDGGAGGPGDSTPPAGGPGNDAYGTGVVSGKISITGMPPAASPIDIAAKPECVQARGESPLLGEKIVAGEGLKDCVVFVSKGAGKYSTPSEAVAIDQIGCQYVPHLFAIQTGQTLDIKNSDPFLHNVSNPSKGMNISMPNIGTETKKRLFTKQGEASLFQCSVHPWMNAYAFVVDNPFHAVTGDDGAFKLEKLPAGKYTISVWHEPDRKLKAPKPQEIEIKEGATEPVVLNFEFSYEG